MQPSPAKQHNNYSLPLLFFIIYSRGIQLQPNLQTNCFNCLILFYYTPKSKKLKEELASQSFFQYFLRANIIHFAQIYILPMPDTSQRGKNSYSFPFAILKIYI